MQELAYNRGMIQPRSVIQGRESEVRHLIGILVAGAAVCLFGTAIQAEDCGDLTATFVYDGDAPEAAALKVTTDVEFCSKHKPVDESFVVNPKNEGIANIVAFMYLGRTAKKPPIHSSYEKTAKAKVKLDNNKCPFEPHVAMLRTPQTLVIGKSDTVGHNCKVDAIQNGVINYTIPAGGSMDYQFTLAERLPSKVSCSIHPRMSGWLLIKDNPYMGVSDKDGKLVIKNVPVGTCTFQFWQEKSGYASELRQNGKATEWRRGRVEIEIKPGENDLGEIKRAPSLFADRTGQ